MDNRWVQNSRLFRFLCWLGRHNWLPPFIWSIGGDNTGWASFFLNLPLCRDVVIGGDMAMDVAVLDYEKGKLFIYRGTGICQGDALEQRLEDMGHHINSCEYMMAPIIEVIEK